MALPQAPKRGQEPRRPQHFGYVPILKGEKTTGYLAGPVLWLDMHTSDQGSKPCLELMTDGELSCPFCAYGLPAVKGACPFYHQTALKPHMVWLDEGDRDRVDKFRFLLRVQFWREKYKGAPLSVEPCTNQEPEFFSTLPEKNRAADVSDSLLRMWKLPELVAWYRGEKPPSDNAVSQKGEPRKSNGQRFGPMTREAAVRYAGGIGEGGADAAEGRGQTNDQFSASARAPSKNGKHKPEG